MAEMKHWSESLAWEDPVSRRPMRLMVTGRHPCGRPLSGALSIEGTRTGYPIVYGVPQLTPELAARHAAWLTPLGLEPPMGESQASTSVESFGFEWSWDAEPRTEHDLAWRVASRFGLGADDYRGREVLDAGCGAGDQSRWILDRGQAARVVGVDLSDAIDVAYRKLEQRPDWFGMRGDVARLPFAAASFSFVYCEGVIQHTIDSAATARELARVLRPGGLIAATHYSLPIGLKRRVIHGLREAIRGRLSRMERTRLLFASGCLAATAHLPLAGWFLGRTFAVANPRMPSFKATWSSTYDCYGYHSYQRHVDAAEFIGYFVHQAGLRLVRNNGVDIVVERLAQRGDPHGCPAA